MFKRIATYFTPDLIFKGDSLLITGKLWMENPPKYFEKITLHTKNTKATIFSVELNVEHLNSSSIKQLLSYFELLNDLKTKGKFTEVKILWNISDDDLDLKELIKDLGNISELKITIGNNKFESN